MPSADTLLEPSPHLEKEKRFSRKYSINRVAVLGAGTMGARIAAHVANAGLPVLLLDIVPAAGGRNSLGVQALNNLKTLKPAAFASPACASLITTGNFEDDLDKLEGCDWVIEAVAENLAIKQALLKQVAEHLHSTAILTTNTSGLPVANIAEHLSPDLRKRWFGTHFFNPPRYMKLLEIIATPQTDAEAIQTVSDFGDRHLGKSVVPANDVQNFIANRIGTFSMLNVFRIMEEQNLTIEEVDLLTGAIVGWPKTGTFRLSDMVGLDVLAAVARNFAASASDERSDVSLPEVVNQLIEKRWLGDKTKQGFYKKDRDSNGKEFRLVLDLATLEYKPAVKASLPSVDQAKNNESLAGRLKTLLSGDPETDKAARFYWQALPELWSDAANRIGEVSDSIVEIDRAMSAGFNWELGPFALWDAAGVSMVVDRMHAAGKPVPPAIEKLLASGGTSWFRNGGTEFFDVSTGTYLPVKQNADLASVVTYKRSNGVVSGNSAISLVDIGDGIGCLELHSKMNVLGHDIVSFLLKTLRPDSDAVKNFDGFVLSTDAPNFSVGANLMQLLLAAQDGEWDEIEDYIKQFQNMTQAIKFCSRLTAPAGMCLGGGTEVSLHSAALQGHLELYMGLVETGVGLIPAGGGCKEMLLRAIATAGKVRKDARGESVGMVEILRTIFETIAMAKVSTSAVEARELCLLADADGISMNRARLLMDAKAQALNLTRLGYTPPTMRTDIAAPGASVMSTLKLGIYLLREGEFISEHDAKVATHVAKALTGGDITPGTLLSEQYLLDLEREAFLSLCGEAKTIERIAFTLKTGKPLRN
jgi:3-hydroxyacyl-CoA dehydrogenase